MSSPIVNDDDYFQTWANINGDTMVSVNWYVYSSSSPITYSSSSGGWSSSWSILPDWVWNLSWIISSLSTTLNEFIPYLVYVWLWIIRCFNLICSY